MRFVRTVGIGTMVLLGLLIVPNHASAVSPEELVRWYGDSSSATGNAVSSGPCDIDGDGLQDAVVGAWFWDKPPVNQTGAAYVLFGDEDPAGGDLNDPGAVGAVRIDGPAQNRTVGIAVACAGDVNGDNFDDFVISDYVGNQAYVILGAEDFGPVDLAVLGDRGFVIKGPPNASFSFGAYAAGDLNADGLSEIGIASIVADTRGRTNNGAIYVVAGKEDVADIDVTDPEEGELLLTVDGARDQDRLGSAGPAGDVDGDGTDDLIVGAYTSNPYSIALSVPGAAYVISGRARGSVDLATLGEADGFAIFGPSRERDRLGVSVAGAGDLNGDGFADLLIGGDGVSNPATGQRPGSVWVVFGGEDRATVYTDTAGADPSVFTCADDQYVPGTDCSSPAARGYWIKGADSDPGTGSESTGYSLDNIGDVNADGIPDAAIGAYGYDPVNPANPPATMAGAGAVYVVHGKADAATIDLAALAPERGYRIDGLRAGDRMGRAVGSVGDFDGNGAPDWLAGGDFAQRPLPDVARAQAGEVMLVLMGTFETSTTLEASASAIETGESVTFIATVDNEAGTGLVSGGAVSFLAGDTPIEGCEAVALTPSETAACTTTFEKAGSATVTASYTSPGQFADSSGSTILSVEPAPVPPRISEPEAPTVSISQDGLGRVGTIECGPGGDCTASASVSRVKFGKKTRPASADVFPTIRENREAGVAVRLSRRAMKLLRKRGSGSIRVFLTAVSPEGGTSMAEYTVRIVYPG